MCSEISDLIAATCKWASGKREIRAVILFGSRARGEAQPASDWDICVVLNPQAGGDWYGIWLDKADGWKRKYCSVTGLPEAVVQFCAPTSEKVRKGLARSARILFLQDFDTVQVIRGV